MAARNVTICSGASELEGLECSGNTEAIRIQQMALRFGGGQCRFALRRPAQVGRDALSGALRWPQGGATNTIHRPADGGPEALP